MKQKELRTSSESQTNEVEQPADSSVGTRSLKIQKSSIRDGIEICNTCVRPVESPFRYKDNSGNIRGCVSACHDPFVGMNVALTCIDKPRYRLPKWITQARAAINANGR